MDPTAGIKAYGDVVRLVRTDPRHLAGIGGTAREGSAPRVEQDFGALLWKALGGVNDMQRRSIELTDRMVTEPESVNVQDVMIAGAEATLAISMTKAIVDRALAAYREIINVR